MRFLDRDDYFYLIEEELDKTYEDRSHKYLYKRQVLDPINGLIPAFEPVLNFEVTLESIIRDKATKSFLIHHKGSTYKCLFIEGSGRKKEICIKAMPTSVILDSSSTIILPYNSSDKDIDDAICSLIEGTGGAGYL